MCSQAEIAGRLQILLEAHATGWTAATRLKEEMDSLELVQLALEVEDEFGIHISNQDLKEVQTVGDILRMLEERMQ